MNTIKYNDEEISYELYRSKIKNIYIYIKGKQVIVKAPNKVKEERILEFLNKKAKWIYEKLEENKNKPEPIKEKINEKDIEILQQIVSESISKYSKVLHVIPNKVRIRELKYAWGSCSSNKNISINVLLARKEKQVIEYVVLHEMCHLIHMNHSRDFWNLVEKNMPGYKEYKRKLKEK